MIAGIPIAIVASAIARASIMTIPLEIGELPERLISSLRNRFRDQFYRASASGVFRRIAFCFAACGNNRASVSRFVTIIGQRLAVCGGIEQCQTPRGLRDHLFH